MYPDFSDNEADEDYEGEIEASDLYQEVSSKSSTKGKTLIKCDICPKQYSSRSGYLYHRNIHQSKNDIPFKCKECRKAFSTEDDLEQHNIVHDSENKPHKCEYCGKGFAKKSDKPRHESTCAANKGREFNCKRCADICSGTEELIAHLVSIHKEEGSFLCEKCQTLFPTKKSLTQHTVKRQCFSPRGMSLRSKGKATK